MLRELNETVTGHADATGTVLDNTNEVVVPAAIPTDSQGGFVDGAGRTDDLTVHAQIYYLVGQGAQGAGHFRRRLCVRWLSQLRIV